VDVSRGQIPFSSERVVESSQSSFSQSEWGRCARMMTTGRMTAPALGFRLKDSTFHERLKAKKMNTLTQILLVRPPCCKDKEKHFSCLCTVITSLNCFDSAWRTTASSHSPNSVTDAGWDSEEVASLETYKQCCVKDYWYVFCRKLQPGRSFVCGADYAMAIQEIQSIENFHLSPSVLISSKE
jgi:hypothetical protein